MKAAIPTLTCTALLLAGCAGGANIDAYESTEQAAVSIASAPPPSESAVTAPAPTTSPTAPAPTANPDQDAPDTIGKPLEDALRGYIKTYGSMWDADALDLDAPLGPQLESDAVALRIAFLTVVEAADADPATANPASNVAALVKVLGEEVDVVEALVSRVLKCATSAQRRPCEIKEFGEQTEIMKSQARVAEALGRIKIQS